MLRSGVCCVLCFFFYHGDNRRPGGHDQLAENGLRGPCVRLASTISFTDTVHGTSDVLKENQGHTRGKIIACIHLHIYV